MNGEMTLNDLAVAIANLALLVSDKFTEFDNRLTQTEKIIKRVDHNLSALEDRLMSEINHLHFRMSQVENRLEVLEGEVGALRQDLLEIYKIMVRIEKKMKSNAIKNAVIRRELKRLKSWARKINAEISLKQI